MQCLLGWLLLGTTGSSRSGSPTEGACGFFHGPCAAPCAEQGGYRGNGVSCGRCPTGRHFRLLRPYRARIGRPDASATDLSLYGPAGTCTVGEETIEHALVSMPALREQASRGRPPPRGAERMLSAGLRCPKADSRPASRPPGSAYPSGHAERRDDAGARAVCAALAGGDGGESGLLGDGAVRRATLSLAGAVVPGAGAAAPRGHPLGAGPRRADGPARAEEPAAVDGVAERAPRRLRGGGRA